MAVQGGLLAATITQRLQKDQESKVKNQGNAMPIISFLIAKIIAYTILGGVLGWLGGFFQLSLQTQVVLQFAVAVFMIGTALNILQVHPIFRYFVIQPPKFLFRFVRNESKSHSVFAPALLGAFTIFIPCGTTQAMMALAIASGNAILGAAILFVFTIGTSPVFFALGYAATKLGGALQNKFMKVAAYSIILLAVFNFNNALALSGSTLTLDSLWKSLWCTVSFCNTPTSFAKETDQPINEATITFNPGGYYPNNLTVKRGSSVTLKLDNKDGIGCVSAFTIPSLGIQKIVPMGNSDLITFTAPETAQEIDFMCGMGMYRGTIQVI